MKKSFAEAEEIFRTHNGLLKSSQARQYGVNPKTLADMVSDGRLVKEERGLYRVADMELSGYEDLIFVCQKIPKAVVCLISALAFYELTTQIPHKVYIALPWEGRYRPKIEYPPVEIFWLSERAYQAGLERVEMDGFSVPIYNREKTVADCFKFRNKIGKDVALEALKFYLASPGKNLARLSEYSRINRVEKIMAPYMEALI